MVRLKHIPCKTILIKNIVFHAFCDYQSLEISFFHVRLTLRVLFYIPVSNWQCQYQDQVCEKGDFVVLFFTHLVTRTN